VTRAEKFNLLRLIYRLESMAWQEGFLDIQPEARLAPLLSRHQAKRAEVRRQIETALGVSCGLKAAAAPVTEPDSA
jgi:hypothetical protein